MTSFLKFAATQLFQAGLAGRDSVIILPSNRSAHQFRTELTICFSGAAVLPEIVSFEQWLSSLSELRTETSSALLGRLYESFRANGFAEMDFARFINWASPLLSDFSEADSGLANAKQLFHYLSEERALETWSEKLGTTDEHQQAKARQIDFIKFYESLCPVYLHFRARLKEDGIGYKGLILREVAENPTRMNALIAHTSVVFVGFSGISKAEEVIWNTLHAAGKLKVYFDLEAWSEDPKLKLQESGLLFRKAHLSAPWWKDAVKFRECAVHQSISAFKAINSIHQVKSAVNRLQEIQQKRSDLNGVALVLADESLLPVVLESLPKTLGTPNITMGFPFKGSILFEGFRTYFNYLEYRQQNSNSVNLQRLLELVELPLWTALVGEILVNEVRDQRVQGKLFVSTDSFTELFKDANLDTLNSVPETGKAFLNFVRKLVKQLMSKFTKGSLEYAASTLMQKELYDLEEWLSPLSLELDIHGLGRLLMSELKSRTIPIEGTRAEGLQVMGLLETRCLDFEEVIVLSVNEGILPIGGGAHYFIPLRLKRTFGMRVEGEEDALAAYYFFRLLKQPRRVSLYYHIKAGAAGTGEPSRFLMQLKEELPNFRKEVNAICEIEEVAINLQPNLEENWVKLEVPAIQKDDAVMNRLMAIVTGSLSASSINSYFHNTQDFFLNKIAKFDENAVLPTDEADQRILGNVLHKTFENLYLPHLKQPLTDVHFKDMFGRMEIELQKSFAEEFEHRNTDIGRNLLLKEICKGYLQKWLEKDYARAKAAELIVWGLEHTSKVPFPLSNGVVAMLNGNLDRIETYGGQLQILDYKTGVFDAKEMRLESFDFDVEAPMGKKPFQLMFYGVLASRDPQFPLKSDSYVLGIVPLRAMKDNPVKPVSFQKIEVIDIGMIREFEQTYLIAAIEDMLNPETPLFRENVAGFSVL